jgi:hypothetical protein
MKKTVERAKGHMGYKKKRKNSAAGIERRD